MRKAALILLLIFCLLTGTALGEEASRRVFFASEVEPFAQGAETFDLYVCPLLGADCMILTCGGETMLVDMGKAKDYPIIQEQLAALGIDHIDIAFNTHPHTDHLGSMRQILADYPVGRFMTAFPETYTGNDVIQIPVLKAIRTAEVPVVTVADGDAFTLGGAQMTVIRQTKYGMPNPLSCMLKIQYGSCTILLTADVIGSAQKYLAETHDLKADIMKMPHHGLNQVAREFLAAIDPEYAFFTHGYANTKQAQAQLERNGIPHDYATWGVIHLSTDGAAWIVEQALNENGVIYNQKYR